MSITDANKRTALGLSLSAALLYNSWPLAFYLDPANLRIDYLSALEISSRPYSWVFALSDALAAALIIAIGARLVKLNFPGRFMIASYITFGAATLLEALTPISSRCSESISACGISPMQIFTLHDLASIVAAMGLLFALISSKRLLKASDQNEKLYNMAAFAYWSFVASGILLVLSVALDRLTLYSQVIFLLACGLAIFMLPWFTFGLSSTHVVSPHRKD